MRQKPKIKSFIKWHHHEVRSELGYRFIEDAPALRSWIDVPLVPFRYPELVEEQRERLRLFHTDWNETELGFQFIGPLLQLVAFQSAGYNSFQERMLRAEVDGWQVEGVVDWMTAIGSFRPEIPIFFLHEYKKTKNAQADPEGQLLIAMVAAQRLNADGQPLYGCYVIGKFWHFVLLEGQTYSVSQGYDATDAGELRIIWSVLVHTKQLIEERVRQILEREATT